MPQQETFSLEIRRVFNAPRERIFNIWTNPAELIQCFALKKAQVDLRPGGKYFWYWDGDLMDGVIQEVERPVLVYQLRGSDSKGRSIGDTLVTVEFHDREEQTELVLRHESFALQEQSEKYTSGWKDCLDAIEKYMAKH
jgi:uncharacterized protein YndB with AHSA1/START domain